MDRQTLHRLEFVMAAPSSMDQIAVLLFEANGMRPYRVFKAKHVIQCVVSLCHEVQELRQWKAERLLADQTKKEDPAR